MRRGLAVAAFAAMGAACGGDAGDSLTVASWGGSYTRACKLAYYEPFSADTDIVIRDALYNGGLAEVRAQVDVGRVHWDIVSMEMADAVRGCDEGLLEPLDPALWAPGADGAPPEEDFFPGTLTECGVGAEFYATVIAYNRENIPGPRPATIQDFFDLEAFPGRRGMRRKPMGNMEFALMADGVSPQDVYAVLDTPDGIERAFRKLDTIKDQIVWWEAGAQPPQLLADGEVTLTTAYNGRIFNPGAGEPALRDHLGRPAAGLRAAGGGGRDAEPGRGLAVPGLRDLVPVHGRGQRSHLLQPHPLLGPAAGGDPRRGRRGHAPAHAHLSGEPREGVAQRLGVVGEPHRRNERALQFVAGALTTRDRSRRDAA